MYSVLIQNQKTMQCFQEYYPLFLELITEGRLGVLRWVESGRTIDTALPGLKSLVDEKEEWRAVIVRVEDEQEMRRYVSVPENPYDFYASRQKSAKETTESKIPLVRLTQMLGEVPAPELSFEQELIKEEGKAPFLVYKPVSDPEAEAAYRELSKKYDYDGKKPSDIILITFSEQQKKDKRKGIEEAFATNHEENSSDFPRRNRYSANTRFVQFTYAKEGETRKAADLFDFWLSVMYLSSAKIDPSSFQAYRLYSVYADISKERFAATLHEKLDELAGCRRYVENEIRLDLEKRMNEKHPAPQYRMDISADMKIPPDTSVHVNEEEFSLCPRSIANDVNKWEGLRSVAEYTLEDIFRRQDRVLDESAERLRYAEKIQPETVTPLDRYEERDMEAELSRTFDEILKTQNKISGLRNVDNEKIEDAASAVRETLIGRITRSYALEVGLGVFAVGIIAGISSFVFPQNRSGRAALGILFVAFLMILMLAVAEAVVLWIQKRRLIEKIDVYNELMEDNLTFLTSDMKMYSKFVSNIVSFSRGKSFLRILSHKKSDMESDYEKLQRHLKEIDSISSRIGHWAKAFYIPVNENRNIEDDYDVDIDIPVKENRLYTLEFHKDYDIPLNYTGDTIRSPLGFVERFHIVREELFENAGSAR